MHDVHAAATWLRIKAADEDVAAEDGAVLDVAVLDDEPGEPSLGGALAEHGAAGGVVLDGAHGPVVKNEVCQQPSAGT